MNLLHTLSYNPVPCYAFCCSSCLSFDQWSSGALLLVLMSLFHVLIMVGCFVLNAFLHSGNTRYPRYKIIQDNPK